MLEQETLSSTAVPVLVASMCDLAEVVLPLPALATSACSFYLYY